MDKRTAKFLGRFEDGGPQSDFFCLECATRIQ